MPVAVSVRGTVEISGFGVRVEATATSDPVVANPASVEGTLAIHFEGPRVYASPGDVQTTGMEVFVAGGQVPHDELVGEVDVQETDDGTTWSFAVKVTYGGQTILGSIHAGSGTPQIGTNFVDIDAVALTSSGVHRTRLVTGGIAHAARLEYTRDGVSYRISGVGPEGRWDGERVTVSLPAGHGLQRSRILRNTASDLGLVNVLISPGPHVYQPIQALDEPFLEWARKLLEPENRTVRFRRNGTLRAHAIGWEQNPRIQYRVTRASLESGIENDQEADRPSEVEVTASVVIPASDGETSDECGVETQVEIRETFSVHAPWVAKQQQAAGVFSLDMNGDPIINPDTFLSDTNAPDRTAELRILSRVVVTTERECGDVKSTSTETWGWFNPRLPRYDVRIDPARILQSTFAGYIQEADTVQGDDAPLYAWPEQRFVVTSRTVRRPTTEFEPTGRGWVTGDEVVSSGYALIRRAAKERNLGTPAGQVTPWEDLSYRQGDLGTGDFSKDLGNGEIIQADGEAWREVVARQVRTVSRDEAGQIPGELVKSFELAHLPGRQYLYTPDDEGSRDERDALQLVQSETTDNFEAGEGGHQQVKRVFDHDGSEISRQTTETRRGHLPAAQRVGTEPVDDEEADPKPTPRTERQRIVRSSSCNALGLRDQVRTERLEGADNADEVESVAVRLAKESCSGRLRLTLPAAVHLTPESDQGRWFRLHLPEIGIDEWAVRAKTAQHVLGIGGGIQTRIEGKKYF